MVPVFSSSLSGLFSADLASGIGCETCLGQLSNSKGDWIRSLKSDNVWSLPFSLLLRTLGDFCISPKPLHWHSQKPVQMKPALTASLQIVAKLVLPVHGQPPSDCSRMGEPRRDQWKNHPAESRTNCWPTTCELMSDCVLQSLLWGGFKTRLIKPGIGPSISYSRSHFIFK